MRKLDGTWLIVLLLTALAGLGLHRLFDLWPSVMTEFFAPVNESLWEHVKLLYWPYLAAGVYMTGRGRWSRSSWLAALLGGCCLLVVLGWQVHLHIGVPAAHVALYVALVVLLFLLPELWQAPESWTGVLSAGAIVLCGMIVCWTIMPPNHPLFHDLSLADTFFPVPV